MKAACVLAWGLVGSAAGQFTPATNKAASDALAVALAGQAQFWNTSFSATFTGAFSPTNTQGLFVSAAVEAGATAPAAIPTTTEFAMGPVTMSWTMAAMLRLIESDLNQPNGITLDTPILTLADALISKENGTTLKGIFQLTATNPDQSVTYLSNVTVRQLLEMTSGLQDFDHTAFQHRTEYEAATWTPYDVLYSLNKTFLFPPGTPGQKAYSAAGFEILGLILASTAGVSSWEDYDQFKGAIPDAIAQYFNQTHFPTSGTCDQVPDMGEHYAINYTTSLGCQNGSITGLACLEDLWISMGNKNCVNGWASGNLASSTTDVALFYNALQNFNLITDLRLNTEIFNFGPITQGWCATCNLQFSAGLLVGAAAVNSTLGYPQESIFIGNGAAFTTYEHYGTNYGTYVPIAGFNPTLNIGAAVVQGSGIGMSFSPDRTEGPAAICNTSSKTNATDLQPAYILNVISAPVAACVAYASVLNATGLAEGPLFIDFRVYLPSNWLFCDQATASGVTPPPPNIGMGVMKYQCTPPTQFIYYDCASPELTACCQEWNPTATCTRAAAGAFFESSIQCAGFLPCLQ